MNFSGSHIGHVADKAGKKKDVPELSIEVSSLMNTLSIQESTSGLTGECKHSLRSQCLISGRRRFLINIHMMMRPYSKSSRK